MIDTPSVMWDVAPSRNQHRESRISPPAIAWDPFGVGKLASSRSIVISPPGPLLATCPTPHWETPRLESALWGKVLANAILDRLLLRSHLLKIKGRSYRLRDLEQAALGRS